MSYVAKSKDKNKFKTIETLLDFKKEDFVTDELFEIIPITIEKYEQLLKQHEIDILKNRLKELGMNVDTVPPQQNNNVQSLPNNVNFQQVPNQSIETEQTKPTSQFQPLSEKISRVLNPKTKQPYSMEEIRQNYVVFKDRVESSIPEIRMSSFNENGIFLSMIEIRHDLPRILPNGIPIRQTLE